MHAGTAFSHADEAIQLLLRRRCNIIDLLGVAGGSSPDAMPLRGSCPATGDTPSAEDVLRLANMLTQLRQAQHPQHAQGSPQLSRGNDPLSVPRSPGFAVVSGSGLPFSMAAATECQVHLSGSQRLPGATAAEVPALFKT